MKFRIFTIQEYIYKWLSSIIVLLFTVGSIVLFLYSKNINADTNVNTAEKISLLNTDLLTFLISIGYALLLFLVNIYITSISTTTQNMFYRRKEQYVNLRELASVYKEKERSDRRLHSFIFMTQGLTGRTGKKELKPIIKLEGFHFTNKYESLENSFIDQQSELKSEWDDRVRNYIQSRKLKTKFMNVHIFDLAEFLNDIDGWTSKNLELNLDQSKQFNNFISRLKREYKENFKKYEKTKRQLNREITKIHNRANSQVQRLERVYGERLSDSINSEYNLVNNLQVLERLIQELDGKMLTYEDYQELASESNEGIEEYLRNMDLRLRVVSENVEELLTHDDDFC
ncbi:hypothetical protein [Paucisalibacillus globulus]|uniref:hypothetical protein n=1 Tax=Paucisalibacillus globulus TaxID=351095 RepID=UPI000BB81936|nr:hypothetical protein [Paucisalibacillus globulus]